jgi:putative transposase
MPYRKVILAPGEYYHVLNRGIGQALIFSSTRERKRFLELIDYYLYDELLSFSHFDRLSEEKKQKYLAERRPESLQIELYAFCLMPNHFHLLLSEKAENKISRMLSSVQNAYVKFFNIKHRRKGPLFESVFKAVRIENDEQFLHVSRYIHLNPCTSYMVEINDLFNYRWTSLPAYYGGQAFPRVNTIPVESLAGDIKSYEKFIRDQVGYQRELNETKHLILEECLSRFP